MHYIYNRTSLSFYYLSLSHCFYLSFSLFCVLFFCCLSIKAHLFLITSFQLNVCVCWCCLLFVCQHIIILFFFISESKLKFSGSACAQLCVVCLSVTTNDCIYQKAAYLILSPAVTAIVLD